MTFPANYAVYYLSPQDEIARKVVGEGPRDTFLYVHADGTVEVAGDGTYALADVATRYDLYADGSLASYTYNNDITQEYMRIDYAHVPLDQRHVFGPNEEYSNGPITFSQTLYNGIQETRTYTNGKPVYVDIERLNPQPTEVFHLNGVVNAAGVATVSLTNFTHPLGLSNTGPGSLAGMLNLNTAHIVTDNGAGLVGNDGSTLVGNDGSTLISDAGWTFNATNPANLITDYGAGLVGQDGGTLVSLDALDLVGNDGSTVVARDGAGIMLNINSMMRGYRAYEGPTTFTQPADDHGATPGTAGTIVVGEVVEGTLETDGDTDWFAIELVAGNEYTFSMSGLDGGVALLEDPRLSLLDANGNVVEISGVPVGDDDDGIGRDARFTFTPSTSGTYHVVASNFGDVNAGTYELSVEVSPTAAFVKSAATIAIPATPLGSAPVMAYISTGEYAGGFVLAWIATSDGQHGGQFYADYHLQVQIVTAQGFIVDLDPRAQYTTYSPDHAEGYNDADDADPSIAVFDDGSFVVTYTDTSYSNSSPKTRTTYLKLNADGSYDASGTMIPGSTGPGDPRYESSGADVITLNNGDWLTILHRWGIDGPSGNNTTNIQVSLNGAHPDYTQPIGPGTDFNGQSAMFQALTTAGTAFGTGAIAVWTDRTGDAGNEPAPNGSAPTTWGVKGAVLSATGTVLASFDVNEGTDFAQVIVNGSQVADLGNGRFVVAWTSEIPGRITDSLFRVFSYENGVVSEVTTGDQPISDGLANNASVVALPAGGFVIVFERDNQIRMQTYSDSGTKVGNETNVASGASGTAAVATDDGRVVVAFLQGGAIKLQHMEPNLAPTDLTLSDSHINENSASGTLVGYLGTTDGNGITDGFTYSIVSSDGRFYIANGNELRFDDPNVSGTPALNYEVAQSHTVTIRTTDSAGITLDETMTISVDNVNENPTGITIDQMQPSEGLPVGSVLATLTAIDLDNAGSFTYSLRDANGQALTGSPFVIDGDQLKLGSALDYETLSGYTIYVRVSDGTLSTGPYNSATYVDTRVSIYVQDVDDTAPHNIRLSNFTDDEFEVDEDEAVGTDLLTLITSDRDTFGEDNFDYQILDSDGTFRLEVDQSGSTHLVLNKALNYEAATEHTLSLRVSDPGGRSYDETFTIDVGNVNEAPVITGGNTTKVITVPVGTSYSTALYSILATDPENDALTYGTNAAGFLDFWVDSSGRLFFNNTANFATTYTFKVYARDQANHTTFQDVQVTVTGSGGPLNTAPVIIGNANIVASINENATQVKLIEATDAEFDTLTWSLSGGPDASKFKLVALSNSAVYLEFKNAPDFEAPTDVGTNNVYNVIARATDSTGAFDDQAIAVTVLNVNETPPTPPSITSNGGGDAAVIGINENSAGVTTVTSTGSGTITYSISGTDADDFNINATTGVLAFKSARNFEAPTDADGNSSYSVVVTASNASQSDSQTLTVNVANLNEVGPTITSFAGGDAANITLKENAVAVASITATDADGGTPIAYSIVGGADAGDFVIDAASGALSFRTPADFENPADANADNVYSVTVAASDGSFSDTQALTITVTNDAGKPKTGTSKADKLNGTNKEEMLDGKEGNDTIKAKAGGDTIIGGTGADKLYGGVDGVTDTYVFLKGGTGTTPNTWDTVYDFVSGIDRIDLSGIDGDPKKGQQDLRFVTKFKDPGKKNDGQFRVVEDGKHVNIEIDLNGDKKADMIIHVMNVEKLLGSDFVL